MKARTLDDYYDVLSGWDGLMDHVCENRNNNPLDTEMFKEAMWKTQKWFEDIPYRFSEYDIDVFAKIREYSALQLFLIKNGEEYYDELSFFASQTVARCYASYIRHSMEGKQSDIILDSYKDDYKLSVKYEESYYVYSFKEGDLHDFVEYVNLNGSPTKTIITREALIEKYQSLYFKPQSLEERTLLKEKKKALLGDIRLPGTDKEVEAFLFPKDEIIACDEIKKTHIAWKSGRLTAEMLREKADIPAINGRGNTIEHLDDFLEKVNENSLEIERALWGTYKASAQNARKALEILFDCKNRSSVKQLGTVYLLAILFFISGGDYPLYDKYAHTAVKALYLGKNPKDVFVGDAPQDSIDKIAGLYEEYCSLLKSCFGTFSIDRALDRALWVYGHKMNDGEDF